MIEEAAGTRMYESKRTSAQRTIEKKDSKLREIEVVSLLPRSQAVPTASISSEIQRGRSGQCGAIK